jgi:preprotein translocase subunit SecD
MRAFQSTILAAAVFIGAGPLVAQQQTTDSRSNSGLNEPRPTETVQLGLFLVLDTSSTGKTRQVDDPYSPEETLVLAEDPILTASDIVSAELGFDQYQGMPVVQIKLSPRGSQVIAKFTTENIGRRLAIVINNKVVSAPRLYGPILDGEMQISGRFSAKEARKLAAALSQKC